MSDGAIVIADRQTSELRVFENDGSAIARIGGRGAGPGEYRTPRAVFRALGDTLWVDDIGHRRVTILDPEFVHFRTIPIPLTEWSLPPGIPGAEPITGRSAARVLGRFNDGTLLTANLVRIGLRSEVTNVSRDSLLLGRFDPATAASETHDVVLGLQRFEFFASDGSVTFGEAPFGYAETIAVSGDRYYYGNGVEFTVEVRGTDGSLQHVIRLCEAPDRLQPADVEAEIERRLSRFSPDQLTYEEPAHRGIPLPSVAPSYTRILIDERQRVWIRDFTLPGGPSRWKLFSPDGEWLAEVETPEGLEILEIGADYILGLAHDELDVQSVRVYDLLQN